MYIRPGVRIPRLLLGILLVLTAGLRADERPAFLIESIEVHGVSPGSERIVIAESRLRAGASYDEGQLRDAAARIQRLPFVISTDFRLSKGSSFGRYVLIVTVQQMKPFFLLAGSTTSWLEQTLLTPLPNGGVELDKEVNQVRTNELVVGARRFLGATGVLNLAAQRVEHRNDRYTVSYTQYDVFGTRASITALASYLEDPGARGRGAPGDRFDWHHRDNITYELIAVVPFGANHSLRGSWQRGERPVSYFRRVPETGQLQHVLRSLPQIRREIFWIYDTTNDPLFPTSGTRISAGRTRTGQTSSGFTELGHTIHDETKVSIEQSWTLTPRQALTLGGNGSDFENRIRNYDIYAQYSFDLWGRERTLRRGDLRLELSADRVFTHLRPQYGTNPYIAQSTARAGVVFRNEWGVLRLNAQYVGWGTE